MDSIPDICDKLRDAGAHIATHDAADMRDPPAVRRMIDNVAERHDGIDILVNNAGI